MPSHSKFKHVEFIPIDEITDEKEGYYIGREDAQNLINNVEELKAYVKKLETLIVEMQEFYKEK